MVWHCVVLPGRQTLTLAVGILKNELCGVGPGPTVSVTTLAPLAPLLEELLEVLLPEELLLEELLLEELLLEELLEVLLPEELLEVLLPDELLLEELV
jgi:hypothetical protein